MRLDSFVSDGIGSLARLTKYRPDFPFSSDYRRQWGAAAHRDLECHSGELGYLGTEERQPGVET
jgi:hypothetical protein